LERPARQTRFKDDPLHLASAEWPVSSWSDKWYGPDHFGTERARVESGLERLPGQQRAIVRYSPRHNPVDEWVYYSPDIDTSKVVWARDMDAAHNVELMRYCRPQGLAGRAGLVAGGFLSLSNHTLNGH
jgi:hypothetical protein